MKIPSVVLRDRITVTPRTGSSAYGPVFGDPVNLRARVLGRRRVVNRADGSTLISSATATVREPRVEVLPESKAEWKGREYEVLDVLPAVDLSGHTVSVDLLLGAR